MKNTKEVALAAVKTNGYALQHGMHRQSFSVQNTKEIVVAAVKNDGRALKYASDNLKKAKKTVFTAVQQTGRVLHRTYRQSFRTPRRLRLHLATVKNDGFSI